MNAYAVTAKAGPAIRLHESSRGISLLFSILLLATLGLTPVLAGCIDESDGDRGTVTPGSEATQPSQSPLVTPVQSQDVRTLPTAPPPQPGSPVYEINPRVNPQADNTPAPESSPTPASQQDTE